MRPTVLLLCCLFLPACTALKSSQAGAKLSIRSQSRGGAVLRSGFADGIYSSDNSNSITVVLFDGPKDNPTQAVTIRLFWMPRAGKTPIDETATNATIHYMIFTGAGATQAGVYSGAGFVYPQEAPGGPILHGSVWEASLLLRDSTDGFKDLLGQAQLQGSFTAHRDDAGVLAAVRRLNVMVRDRLGYPRLVEGTGLETVRTIH